MADISGETILFLERDRFYLYSNGKILSLIFPPDIVMDLDVKKRDTFYNLATTFIQNNKLEPALLFIVISDAVCFTKDFPVKDPNDTSAAEANSRAFIDTIPFNSVLSKTYKTPTAFRVVATNQELVDVIVDAFTHKGFSLTAVVPASIYPEFGTSRELTDKFAQHIIDTNGMAKESNMVGEEEVPESHDQSVPNVKQPKSKLLPYLLIGFAVLLVILVITIVTRK